MNALLLLSVFGASVAGSQKSSIGSEYAVATNPITSATTAIRARIGSRGERTVDGRPSVDLAVTRAS